MRRILLAAALLTTFAAPAWPAQKDAALDEMQRSFTLDKKPVPPEVFADFGDSDLADSSQSIRVTIDLRQAIGSNLYADDITLGQNGWISQQKKVNDGSQTLTETTSYKYVGVAKNGLLVVIATYSGGGSGDFVTLHILDAAVAHAFDSDGKRYDRLNLTVLRNMPLGDRWDGSVTISGNTITIVTDRSGPNSGKAPTQHIEAIRPN